MPISPVTCPAARSPDSTRYAVEVLPAVPVMPITVSRGGGLAVDRGGDGAEHRARVGYDQRRQSGRGRRRRPGRIGQYGHRAGRGGRRDELGAVSARSG